MLSVSLNKTFPSFDWTCRQVDSPSRLILQARCTHCHVRHTFIFVYSYHVIPFSVFVELQAAKLLASGAAVLVAVVDVVKALALRVPLTPHKPTHDLFSSWLVS